VIGCGYWGPNLIRNFSHLKGSEVLICSDLNEERLAHMRSLYPRIETSIDFRRVLARSDVDAVVVATPPETHPAFTSARCAGYRVRVPLALSASEAPVWSKRPTAAACCWSATPSCTRRREQD
jgi:hypothetical protein